MKDNETKKPAKSFGSQTHFLTKAKTERLEVVVSILTGQKFEGRIKAFDTYTIAFECQGKEGLLFKAGICSIFPKTTTAKSRLRRVEINPENKRVD